MPQRAPWDMDWSAPQQPAPVSAPGFIPGRPKAQDPLAVRRDERAEQASLRAEESNRRANDAAARSAAAADRQARIDEQKLKGEGKPTESERTAAFLATRLAGSLADVNRITTETPDAARPELDTAILGGLVGRGATNSGPRNRVEDAQLDVLDAALTLGTGAAYTREQLEGYRESYFPQYWDSPEAVAEKKSRLDRVLQAARVKAGNAAPLIDKALGAASPDQRPHNISEEGISPLIDAAAGMNSSGPPQSPEMLARGLASGHYTIDENQNILENGQPVDVPDNVANSDQFAAAYKKKFGKDAVLQVSVVGGQPTANERDTFGGEVDAAVRGIADTATLGFADELAAGADTIFGGGTMAQNLRRQRGIDATDEKVNPYARLAGQVAGGFALPTGGARTAGELARVGGGYGAAYGFGSADGDIRQRLAGAGTGGIAGAGLGYGLGALGNVAAARVGGRTPPGGGGPTAGQELLAAAGRQGIDVLPADVGGPLARRMTAGVVQTPFGSGPIVAAADRAQGQAAGRLSAIANAEGTPLRQEQFGEAAQQAAQGYIDRTGEAARQAYGSAREMSHDTLVQGRGAFQNINAQIRELAPTRNTDAPLISGLMRLRDDIATDQGLKSLSVDSIRRLRTSTRAEAATEGLRGTDYSRRAKLVLDDLSNDIASQLPPDAARAFRAADRAYAERLHTIDDVMEQVVGRTGDRSAEAVANRLITMGRGDSARLRTFLNSVAPEEAGIVRGSLIQEMGRAKAGQQNAAGNEFSLQTFLTNWDTLPARTRDLLFRGEHRQAIEDLARVAEGARNTRAYANTSGTAGATNASRLVTETGRAASIGGMVSTLGGSVVLENLTGRLLGSRRFAQWLARAPRDPAQNAAWVRRLGTIAAREPMIANDILPIQQALQQTPLRAAADDKKKQ